MNRNLKPRKLFAKNKPSKASGNVSLQITSMADVFTILLVFLLKGISSDALTITPSNETKLPSGINTSALSETALTVELTQTGIIVEKEFVSHYEKFESALDDKLKHAREKQNLISKMNESVKTDSRVILLADQSIPFSTIKKVLNQLSNQGFSDVKFGALKE